MCFVIINCVLFNPLSVRILLSSGFIGSSTVGAAVVPLCVAEPGRKRQILLPHRQEAVVVESEPFKLYLPFLPPKPLLPPPHQPYIGFAGVVHHAACQRTPAASTVTVSTPYAQPLLVQDARTPATSTTSVSPPHGQLVQTAGTSATSTTTVSTPHGQLVQTAGTSATSTTTVSTPHGQSQLIQITGVPESSTTTVSAPHAQTKLVPQLVQTAGTSATATTTVSTPHGQQQLVPAKTGTSATATTTVSTPHAQPQLVQTTGGPRNIHTKCLKALCPDKAGPNNRGPRTIHISCFNTVCNCPKASRPITHAVAPKPLVQSFLWLLA